MNVCCLHLSVYSWKTHFFKDTVRWKSCYTTAVVSVLHQPTETVICNNKQHLPWIQNGSHYWCKFAVFLLLLCKPKISYNKEKSIHVSITTLFGWQSVLVHNSWKHQGKVQGRVWIVCGFFFNSYILQYWTMLSSHIHINQQLLFESGLPAWKTLLIQTTWPVSGFY